MFKLIFLYFFITSIVAIIRESKVNNTLTLAGFKAQWVKSLNWPYGLYLLIRYGRMVK